MKETFFSGIYEEAKRKSEYWKGDIILEFTEHLYRLMTFRKISKSDLARRLGTSPAYVTKVLRGDANFTVDSMVKLTMAVGGRLQITVSPEEKANWNEVCHPERGTSSSNLIGCLPVSYDYPTIPEEIAARDYPENAETIDAKVA